MADAIEQQAATGAILRIISESPADALPVFRTIVASATRLCQAHFAAVLLLDGARLHSPAHTDITLEFADYLRRGFAVGRDTTSGRAALLRTPVQVPDVLSDPEFEPTAAHLSEGVRTVLAVPMLRGDRVLGVIITWRREVRPFVDGQIALLQTFADQAVIALENVRLLEALQAKNRELTSALEQQTATGEILGAISRATTDVQPVFDTIATAALKLCAAASSNVFTFDGKLLRAVAVHTVTPAGAEAVHRIFPRPLDRRTAVGRAVTARALVAIHDTNDEDDYALETAEQCGFRSVVGVPLMRDGAPVGAIAVGRSEPGPFPEEQLALLRTFADQAVIAIENVRLFNELQAKNRELTDALEQQTATSEVLRVTSQSPTNVQRVFDVIVSSATRLCESQFAFVLLRRGELLELAARTECTPEFAAFLAAGKAANRGSATGRAALLRAPVQILDFLSDPEANVMPAHRAEGVRTVLAVPMLRDDELLGVVATWRREVRPFSDKQVRLLETFAAQAVIAIENMRLFNELQARTAELTQSVDQLRALSEVGQAVTSTLDLEAVLRTIVARATELAEVDGGSIFEYDPVQEVFHLRATDRLPDELAEAIGATPMARGEGLVGQLAITGEPTAVTDITDEHSYRSHVRDILLKHGYRSLLALPLLHERRVLGGLVVNRKRAGGFPPRSVELLKTFAAQSALAMHNARLFRELEDKGRQLEIASRHKSAFLANMSHELRTPLNAIIGFTRIVMRRSADALEPKQLENLEKILASGQHLLSLINAILDLAKVEAGRVEIVAGEVAPGPLLEQCARTVEPLLKDSVALVKEIDAGLPSMLVDEEKLRQIIINLLSNASKFTERGAVTLRAHAVDGDLAVAVADTGIGIAADKTDLIFEQFEQAHADGARLYGGTGLGLAIARQLARLMGGDIGVDSTLGRGSTFTLRLPLRRAPPTA